MSDTENSGTANNIATEGMWKLVEEIKDLVTVRTTLGYGTGTGVRKSAESTISRAISAKVDELSRLIVDEINA
jgi:hypothetical protein